MCKQWYLASQESWRSFKQLDVDRAKWRSGKLKKFTCVEMATFKGILEACGSYLTKIDFTCLCTETGSDKFILNRYDIAFDLHKKNKALESFEGIKALTSNCIKIEELSLSSLVINSNDQHLLELFRRNRKIRFLNLMGYDIIGACFFGLSAEMLTTLLLQKCTDVLSENLRMVSDILTRIFTVI